MPQAELAELVDALDSGSSVRKDFRVQVPGSALIMQKIFGLSWFSNLTLSDCSDCNVNKYSESSN